MPDIDAAVEKAIVIWAAEYLSKENTIKYLQGSHSTLENLIDHGLERKMIGRRAYYKKSDINRIISEL